MHSIIGVPNNIYKGDRFQMNYEKILEELNLHFEVNEIRVENKTVYKNIKQGISIEQEMNEDEKSCNLFSKE